MKHICTCGHDYAAHFNGNDDTDLSCFHCDCKDFKSEEETAVVAQLAGSVDCKSTSSDM